MTSTRKPKIVRADEAPTREMRQGRGTQHRYVGPEDGAENVDVHLNVLNTDSGFGPYHYHERAENVYVVIEGTAKAVVGDKRYLLRPGDVAFVPPGIAHAAGSNGDGPVTILEVYAPGGDDYHIIADSYDESSKP